MSKIYRKIAQPQGVAIYQADNGDKLILVPVNRDYQQSKRPIFYLKQGKGKQKPRYLSGLFATDNPSVFSGDTKDKITGIKRMFTVTFEEGGDRLIIEGV